MLSWFLHLRIYLWNNTLTIVWIVNRDHNVSARTFRHLSAQSAVEYSMLTYLITSVASYAISSSYKNFLHFHLVNFFFFFFFWIFICCLISVFETILAGNSHIEWNQYQWPTLVQKKLVLFKEGEMRYNLTFIYN